MLPLEESDETGVLASEAETLSPVSVGSEERLTEGSEAEQREDDWPRQYRSNAVMTEAKTERGEQGPPGGPG